MASATSADSKILENLLLKYFLPVASGTVAASLSTLLFYPLENVKMRLSTFVKKYCLYFIFYI